MLSFFDENSVGFKWRVIIFFRVGAALPQVPPGTKRFSRFGFAACCVAFVGAGRRSLNQSGDRRMAQTRHKHVAFVGRLERAAAPLWVVVAERVLSERIRIPFFDPSVPCG